MRKIFSEPDFDELRGSDRFFVRKLASGASDTLLDRLDTELLQAPVEPTPNTELIAS